MVTGRTCTASAFLTVASILASNGGNITVAYVTKRMLDPRDQKVSVVTILIGAAVSWTLGIVLASYFYAQDYLGSHRDVYCCTTVVARADVAGPVFLCFAVAITAMVILYSQAYRQVKLSVLPQHGRTGKHENSAASDGSASGSSEEQQAAAVAPATNPASPAAVHQSRGQQLPSPDAAGGSTSLASPSGRSAQPQRVSSASSAVARRGSAMVLVYYGCWSLVTLNAIFELAGWDSRSVWWDIAAALMTKTQPGINALIMIHSMWEGAREARGSEGEDDRLRPLSPVKSVSRLQQQQPSPPPPPISAVRQRPGKSKPTSPVGGTSVLVKEKSLGGDRPSQASQGSDGPDSSRSHRRALSGGVTVE